MSDKALKKAENVRDDMTARIAEIEKILPVYRDMKAKAERFIADWHEFAEDGIVTQPHLTAMEIKSDSHDTKKPTRPKNPSKERVAAVACEIIRENGFPLTRAELFDALLDRGIVLEGKNPQMVLSTMIWRMPNVIVRLKGNGYWPADDPLPIGAELYVPKSKGESQVDDSNTGSDLLSDRETTVRHRNRPVAHVKVDALHEIPREHNDPE